MEQQESPLQQDSAPVQKEKSKAPLFIAILASVFTTALLVGGGVYYWQQSSFKKQTLDIKSQLEQVKSDNAALVSKLESDNAALVAKIEDLEKIASGSAAEKEAIEKKTCKGVWKNGICVKSTCVDSDVNEKPDDIYIKGSVTYTDENGVETVVYDECTGSKTQVNEMWCYESPAGSGNYVQGKMVYNCTKGCLDGKCTK
jgi:subtilisin family serine protease